MSLDPVKNFAKVTVSTGYDSSATTIVLSSGYGAKLPAPATDGNFQLVWWNSTDYPDPSDDPNVEIVRCTARSTDTLTVTRAQEGTSATNKNTSGKTYLMILAFTKLMRDDINTHIDATGTAVHGLGTISTQNANNVSITGGSITGITDLAVADGGTGASNAADARSNLGALSTSLMTTLGDILYEDATPAPARLAGNTTTTKKFLTQTGNGTISAVPAWGTIGISDVSGAAASGANSDITSLTGLNSITPGTNTLTLNENGNNNVLLIDNDGTAHGLKIQQDGVLATSNYALYLYSNAAQTNAPLVLIHQDNASSTKDLLQLNNDGGGNLLVLTNNGTDYAIALNQAGVLATNREAVRIYSNAVQTKVSALLKITHDNASSNANCNPLHIKNDSLADTIYIENTSIGNSIQDDSGAKLTAAGVWTDAVSIFSEKENVKPLSLTGDYIQKLKNLKLFKYQKKREVYGAKEETGEKDANGKFKKDYPKIKKNPNAKVYKGYILDDPSTPEELISRDLLGNINGVSPTDGVNFLLAVNKELLMKIEQLEQRITNIGG